MHSAAALGDRQQVVDRQQMGRAAAAPGERIPITAASSVALPDVAPDSRRNGTAWRRPAWAVGRIAGKLRRQTRRRAGRCTVSCHADCRLRRRRGAKCDRRGVSAIRCPLAAPVSPCGAGVALPPRCAAAAGATAARVLFGARSGAASALPARRRRRCPPPPTRGSCRATASRTRRATQVAPRHGRVEVRPQRFRWSHNRQGPGRREISWRLELRSGAIVQ